MSYHMETGQVSQFAKTFVAAVFSGAFERLYDSNCHVDSDRISGDVLSENGGYAG